VVQDRVEVGLVDVRIAASVGVAQRRQCLVDGGGGLGAALFELDCSALLGSSTVAVVSSPTAAVTAWRAA
jgi:hypothetical protein